jgi:large exoprotein involved in heme utilization and adhesion
MRLSGRSSSEEFTGITTLSQPGSTGRAGNIQITTADLGLDDGAEISARPVGLDAFGAAGNLDFEIGKVLTLRSSTISTESQNAAGGNIDMQVGRLLDMEDSAITTSVTSGPESGGNITIDPGPRDALVLDHSRIVAQADLGAGGDIFISTGLLIADPSSVISASSNAQLDGSVVIEGFEAKVNPAVTELSTPLPDAAELLKEPCAARRPGAESSFVVEDRIVFPLDADDYLPAPLPRILRSPPADEDPASPGPGGGRGDRSAGLRATGFAGNGERSACSF